MKEKHGGWEESRKNWETKAVLFNNNWCESFCASAGFLAALWRAQNTALCVKAFYVMFYMKLETLSSLCIDFMSLKDISRKNTTDTVWHFTQPIIMYGIGLDRQRAWLWCVKHVYRLVDKSHPCSRCNQKYHKTYLQTHARTNMRKSCSVPVFTASGGMSVINY